MDKKIKILKKLRGIFNLIISAISLRFTDINYFLLKNKIKKLKIDRLHIGCGNLILPNWLNIYLDYKDPYGIIRNKGILNYNILNKWPIEPESIKFIAAAHFIEHLDLNDGIKFVKKCFLSMQQEGVIRLSCPDLELYAKAYVNKNQSFFSNPLIREACMFKNASTFGEIFIAKAYDSCGAHKWFYDFESLEHILNIAGFKNIRKVSLKEGDVPFINKIELDKREMETLYVEAQKIN